jgi:hypothetical protein
LGKGHRKDQDRSPVCSHSPPQAAGNALAIAAQILLFGGGLQVFLFSWWTIPCSNQTKSLKKSWTHFSGCLREERLAYPGVKPKDSGFDRIADQRFLALAADRHQLYSPPVRDDGDCWRIKFQMGEYLKRPLVCQDG